MEKTTTLNLRVNPDTKENAEKVLTELGISMSAAVNMFLNQISLTGGIPFAVTLPKEYNMFENMQAERLNKYADACAEYIKSK